MSISPSRLLKGTPLAAAMLLVAAVATTPAYADYRCDSPKLKEDQRACELARLSEPDQLRQFIQATRGVYNLYMPDYVSDRDVKRWDLARMSTKRNAPDAIARDEGRAVNPR